MKIRCENLTAAYNDQVVFKSLSIEFPENSVNTIIGPSGSGKSTLLRLIASLDEPKEGKIYYGDKEHCSLRTSEIRKLVGMIFQKPTLFEGTVHDNLTFGLKLRKEHISETKINEILKSVDIPTEYLNKTGDELSIGEQQRICIVRSLLLDPPVIL